MRGQVDQQVFSRGGERIVRRSFTVLEPANESGVLRVQFDDDELGGGRGWVRESDVVAS